MRVLICSLDSPGFLFPVMHLALSLRERGIHVAFLTGGRWADTISAAGFEWVPAADGGAAFAAATWHEEPLIVRQRLDIERAIASFRPDLIVGHVMVFGAMLAAEQAELPLVVMGFCTYLFPRVGQDEANTPPERWKRLCWRRESMLARYNRCRRLSGLSPVAEDDVSALSGTAMILRSVPELECDAGRLPAAVQFGGACLWEPTVHDASLMDWLQSAADQDLPIVYADHSRVFQDVGFWPVLKQSLGGRRIRVAVSIGRMGRPAGAIPDNFFVRAYVPQGRVLAHAAALVGSGSTTAVLGAITRGVPCVLLPGGGEQPDVAEQCVAAGVGRMIPSPRVTPEALADALDDVTTTASYRGAARTLAAAFRRYTIRSLMPLFTTSARASDALVAEAS